MRYLILIPVVLLLTMCDMSTTADSDDSETIPDEYCLPPSFTVTNRSEYTLNRVYVHPTPDYLSSIPVLTDLASGASAEIAVAENDTLYLTFIRNITSTSSIEIAVTIASPAVIEYCRKYTLYFLEEDFLLYTDYNLSKPESAATY